MSLERLIAKVGLLLEVSPVQKSMIIPCFLLIVFLQYFFFDLYFVLRPSRFTNETVMMQLIILDLVFIAITLLMIALRHKLERSAKAQTLVPYVFSIFYVSTLMIFGYAVGHMSLVTGIVTAAAPLFAIILFDRKVVGAILLAGGAWFAAINAFYLMDILPYAPKFTFDPTQGFEAKAFYLFCMIFFTFPHFLSALFAAYLLLSYWRLREEDFRRMSLTDSLIGMSNRRAISDELVFVLEHRSPQQPVSIVLVDIDFFKHVNDTFGHQMGDMVLCRVGECLSSTLRSTDRVGRYGGEEFLMVLPNTPIEIARHIAERCRVALEQEVIWSDKNELIPVTASFGVYCSTIASDDITQMIASVDVQLYRAKESGRNRVCSGDADNALAEAL